MVVIEEQTKSILMVLVLVAVSLSGGIAIGLGSPSPGGHSSGLRIGNSYIKTVTPEQAHVSDVYVDTLFDLAGKCGPDHNIMQTFDLQSRPTGATFFCRKDNSTFTFWYSDRWREGGR